jgi:thiol:disulfide interchange protein
MKKFFFSFFIAFVALNAFAQIEQPVKWSFSSKQIDDQTAEVIIKAKIDKGWHIYSQFTPDGGPLPTIFTFNKDKNYTTTGKVTESPEPHKAFEDVFGVDVLSFEKEVIFKQKIKLNTDKDFKVSGNLEFMACIDGRCLPPELVEFVVPVTLSSGLRASSSETVKSPESGIDSNRKSEIGSQKSEVDSNIKSEIGNQQSEIRNDSQLPTSNSNNSLWTIFIAGFLGGFIALLTPCVFPMIPLTVSFFTKRNKDKSKAISQAFTYGISIILIYVALGMIITLLFGADALNDMASNAIFNLLFFVILMVFAFSFFGAFELVIPSSFVNKMDAKSDKGGLLGIFFMAFTLALVSFSCTGPIIGTLLVQTAVGGQKLAPVVGMFGFSFALAIPFTLFAMFPSWMNSLPKSGGWLNSVKVVLGFLELALALKFLSNVDLAYHWGVLDREVFLVLWIIIFAMLGLYLLGKLKFSHDSDLKYISVPRLLMAIVSLGFALYMVPGLWGAPLKAISAFSPPQATQDFDLHTNHGAAVSGAKEITPNKKYSDILHCPHNLNCFFDYDEGMAYAKKMNKPVMIDFTGHSCVNCRKMEVSVWSDPQVLQRMNDDYVLISLYVDDKTALPENERYTSAFSGKKIKTVGNKWSDLQASKYGINSQPYYVLLDHEGNVLTQPEAFNLDIQNYINFLDKGKKAFNEKKLTANGQ